MIFNPLFLTETGNSQVLSPKSGKLSNNKYLFSDIVKVVMNPTAEQKKLTSETENILGGNVGLLLENSKNPVKIKLQILSDVDNEEAKLGLAEILPEEIAQLLTNDQFEVDEKAISYISKELLNGELQTFVNNLAPKAHWIPSIFPQKKFTRAFVIASSYPSRSSSLQNIRLSTWGL